MKKIPALLAIAILAVQTITAQPKLMNASEQNRFTIEYELNGGTNNSANPTDYTENATITLKDPTRENHRFDGWYWDSGFTKKLENSTFTRQSTTLKIYAKWTRTMNVDLATFGNENMVVIIPAGQKVLMEDFAGTSGSQNIHSYSISKYEVTIALFSTVMGFNPTDKKAGDIEMLPVENVTWYDAVYFCNELTKKTMSQNDCCYTITNIEKNENGNIYSATVTRDETKKGYRLPTEAEWEMAARGGTKGGWDYEYAGSNSISEVAWYYDSTAHKVGTKKPNAAGLYDMSGNVFEWCDNLSLENYYYSYRGGSYFDYESDCHVSNRFYAYPSITYRTYNRNFRDQKINCIGFRVCRSLSDKDIFSIEYELNGGTSDNTNPTKYTGNDIVQLKFPTKEGFIFDGWYFDAEFRNKVENSAICKKSTSLKLYAKWIDFSDFETENMVEIIPAGQKVTKENFIKGTQTINGYSISKYEVTQALFQDVMGFNLSKFKGDDNPVECVTWYDAVMFCNKLTMKVMSENDCCYTIANIKKNEAGRITSASVTCDKTKKGYRLPTEAEWEMAARGGTKGGWDYTYSGSNNINEVA